MPQSMYYEEETLHTKHNAESGERGYSNTPGGNEPRPRHIMTMRTGRHFFPIAVRLDSNTSFKNSGDIIYHGQYTVPVGDFLQLYL